MVIEMEEKVKEVIDDIRPFLMNDGGNIELIKIEDNIVYVALQGACRGCALIDYTFAEGIEKIILEKVPEVKGVRLVNED